MKHISIIINRQALFDDISSLAYSEGEIIHTDSGDERRELQDIVEDGNVGRVLRLLNLAYSECLEALYPYCKTEVADDSKISSDIDDNVVGYLFNLSVPNDFSSTTHTIITRYIHECMVARVLFELISIVNPQSAAKWQMKYIESLKEVKSRLNNRTKIVRRKAHPF